MDDTRNTLELSTASAWTTHWLGEASADLARVLACPAGTCFSAEENAAFTHLGELASAAATEDYVPSNERLLELLRAAFAFHDAASRLRAAGSIDLAEDRAAWGQLFLTYVAEHVGAAVAAFLQANMHTPHDTMH